MLGKISRGASFLLLIFNLRFQHGAHQIVDFVLSNPLIRPVQVPSELNRFAAILTRKKSPQELDTSLNPWMSFSSMATILTTASSTIFSLTLLSSARAELSPSMT